MYSESKYFGMGFTLGNEVIITSNFRSSACAFDKEIFKTISIIDAAHALIKYTAQLFFSKAKLAGKLRNLRFIVLAFYSSLRNSCINL